MTFCELTDIITQKLNKITQFCAVLETLQQYVKAKLTNTVFYLLT